MDITRNGSQPSAAGPEDWFTGQVRIDAPFKAAEPARVAGAVVTFEPGARTAWHTHPVGPDADCDQREGTGSAQRRAGGGDSPR